jgi:putative endonuclease
MAQALHVAKRWYVYIVRCADGSLYTGVAIDVLRRVDEHNGARNARDTGARYTRARRPVTLVYQQDAANRSAACQREYRIKQLSRTEKLALIGASALAATRAKPLKQPLTQRPKPAESSQTPRRQSAGGPRRVAASPLARKRGALAR